MSSPPVVLRCGDKSLDLTRPVVMGVLNVTPDSFSDGGRFVSVVTAVEQGVRMAAEGAALIDVGGESTRPGAEPVSADEELRRVIPVIERLRAATTAQLQSPDPIARVGYAMLIELAAAAAKPAPTAVLGLTGRADAIACEITIGALSARDGRQSKHAASISVISCSWVIPPRKLTEPRSMRDLY